MSVIPRGVINSQVSRDTAEAERSNSEREREAEKMRSRLKTSLQTYEVTLVHMPQSPRVHLIPISLQGEC